MVSKLKSIPTDYAPAYFRLARSSSSLVWHCVSLPGCTPSLDAAHSLAAAATSTPSWLYSSPSEVSESSSQTPSSKLDTTFNIPLI